MSRDPTYKGGVKAVLAQYEGRRDAFDYAPGEALPAPDLDLAALATRVVADPDTDAAEAPPFRSSYHRKRHALRQEFTGASELCFLNGLLISHLRKRDWPEHAPALFRRLWAEQADHLIARLDSRWLVSSVTTFGDHGETATQRATGLALTALFGAMKLYESERLFSGLPPDTPFPAEARVRARLPLEMDAYSVTAGGLDINLIARLWQEAEGDATIAPLAHHLLDLLIHDERTVMRRLMTMRAAREKEARAKRANIAPVPADRLRLRAETLRWGIVSTIRAPLPAIARFAAHHLELGAAALHLHLDEPDAATAAFLRRHPDIHVTDCDAGYWQALGKPRPDQHQLRQAMNATRTLRAVTQELDWLLHVDVDEFLLADAPVNAILATVPPACAMARVAPAEALAREDGQTLHFKLTHKQAGVKKALLQDIYPTFGMHLHGGFLSHTTGKVFARTGIPDTRLGIHTLKHRGEDATNRIKPAGLLLAHLHAPGWDHFRSHLEFRRTRGSYRPRSDRPELGQAALLQFLAEEEGEAGLRAFFDEVCADTPALRARLAEHGMLVSRPDFDPDAAVARIFGRLP